MLTRKSSRCLRSLAKLHKDASTRTKASAINTALYEERDELSDAMEFSEMPGPASIPILGTTYKYFPKGEYDFNRMYETSLKKYLKYGKIVREEITSDITQVHLFDPKDIEKIYRVEGRLPRNVGLDPLRKYREDKQRPIGFLNMNGPDWHRLRGNVQRKITKPRHARSYVHAVAPVARDLVGLFQAKRNQDGEIPDCLNDLYMWAMESIGAMFYDNRLGTLTPNLPSDSEPQQVMRALIETFDCFHKLLFNLPLYKSFKTPTYKKMERNLDYLEEVLLKRLNDMMKRQKTRLESEDFNEHTETSLFLSMLKCQELSQDEAIMNMMDMTFAGIETTAHALGFMMGFLATHPEVQEKLHQEITRVLPGDAQITPSSFDHFHYMKAVMKESFRLAPATNNLIRIFDRDVVLSGYRIPAGSMIASHFQVLCRSPEYFDEPDSFIPERWVRGKEGRSDLKCTPAVLQPFGHGPKSCVARRLAEMELITTMAEMFRRVRLEYHHGPIGIQTKLINMPDKPLKFKVIDRT